MCGPSLWGFLFLTLCALKNHYELQISSIVYVYVKTLHACYMKNKVPQWKHKLNA